MLISLYFKDSNTSHCTDNFTNLKWQAWWVCNWFLLKILAYNLLYSVLEIWELLALNFVEYPRPISGFAEASYITVCGTTCGFTTAMLRSFTFIPYIFPHNLPWRLVSLTDQHLFLDATGFQLLTQGQWLNSEYSSFFLSFFLFLVGNSTIFFNPKACSLVFQSLLFLLYYCTSKRPNFSLAVSFMSLLYFLSIPPPNSCLILSSWFIRKSCTKNIFDWCNLLIICFCFYIPCPIFVSTRWRNSVWQNETLTNWKVISHFSVVIHINTLIHWTKGKIF